MLLYRSAMNSSLTTMQIGLIPVTPEELARFLTEQRKQQGFTQQQVADYVGCHISQTQSFEYKPRTNRKLQTYIDYAEAIGLTLTFGVKPLDT